MSDHVIEWLGAYLDNELHGNRLHQVESHLKSCQSCRIELEELRRLSILLRENDPTEELFPAERFTSQVMLRLPRRIEVPRHQNFQDIRGWLVPVGAFVAWLFFQTVFLVSWLAETGAQIGLFGNVSSRIIAASPTPLWTATIASFFNGGLSQGGLTVLQILEWTEALGRGFWGSLGWQIAIALIYWGGLILWWRRQQQRNTRITE